MRLFCNYIDNYLFSKNHTHISAEKGRQFTIMCSPKLSSTLSKHRPDVSAGCAGPTEVTDDWNIRALSAEGPQPPCHQSRLPTTPFTTYQKDRFPGVVLVKITETTHKCDP